MVSFTLRLFCLWKRTRYPFNRGWVGPRGGLKVLEEENCLISPEIRTPDILFHNYHIDKHQTHLLTSTLSYNAPVMSIHPSVEYRYLGRETYNFVPNRT